MIKLNKKNIILATTFSVLITIGITGCSESFSEKKSKFEAEVESTKEAANIKMENSKKTEESEKETEIRSEYKTITPEEAKKLLEQKENVVLLDVRTKEEYDEKHIPKSQLIPLNTLKEKAESQLKDKETIVLIYCRSGNRSKTASKILLDLGYKNIYDLGGIIDWPYEIERAL